MYCRFCGIEIKNDSKFCHGCGKSIAESGDKAQNTKPTLSLLSSKHKSPKDVIYLSWWTLLILILGVIIYDREFYDVVPLFPIYFGVILLVYTIRFYKQKQDLKESQEDNNQESTKDIAAYSLQDFADIYGKMQICRYQDEYGAVRSKCVFTRSIDVYFGNDIGELNAKEVVANKNILLVQKTLYGDRYIITAKAGETIIKQPSSVPPPLDKISANF